MAIIDEHVHASDLARFRRSTSNAPRPGSLEEAEALARIDEARCDLQDEITGRADQRRRRQARRYWQERGAHVDV